MICQYNRNKTNSPSLLGATLDVYCCYLDVGVGTHKKRTELRYKKYLHTPTQMSHEAHLLHTPLIDDALSALFNSEVMSDLIVVWNRSGNKLFHHRFIVCDENDFFSACMMSGMWKCEEGAIVIIIKESLLLHISL